MLDLVQVRSFLEVAERGTVVAAATALGYTPPAVTQHVLKLERSLEVALFDRVGGRLVLNDAGRGLLPLAREIVTLAGRAADAVGAPPTRPRVVVTGIASALAALVLPRLAAAGADADVSLVEAEDAGAVRELRLGHADIALIQEYPGDQRLRDARLDHHLAARDELRLVLPPSWSPDRWVHDLGDLPWIVNGTGTRCEAATRVVLGDAGLEPTISGDVSDNHLLLGLVEAGHGATIVPELVLATSTAHVTVATEPLPIARKLIAVTRPKPSRAVAVVLEGILTVPTNPRPTGGRARRGGRRS